jgi:hypothetical protein
LLYEKSKPRVLHGFVEPPVAQVSLDSIDLAVHITLTDRTIDEEHAPGMHFQRLPLCR